MRWSDEEIVELIQEWVHSLGEVPRCDDFISTQGYYPSYSTVIRHFGSWNKAIVAAGFNPRPQGVPFNFQQDHGGRKHFHNSENAAAAGRKGRDKTTFGGSEHQ